MSKKDDIDDLLGDSKPAAKKAAPKKDAKAEKPAPAAKKTKEPEAPAAKKAAPKAEPKEKAKKEPIRFEEGERATIESGVLAHFKRSKKAINSRELAEKLGTETRKLRLVLYKLANRAEPAITLESGESKVSGMTVSPA